MKSMLKKLVVAVSVVCGLGMDGGAAVAASRMCISWFSDSGGYCDQYGQRDCFASGDDPEFYNFGGSCGCVVA